jgi:hypothetical protein
VQETRAIGELRAIEGFPGYSVAADGRVWSDRSQKFLTPTPTGHGYQSVRLRRVGESVTVIVHRAVALAWVPNPRGAPHVNHIDGDQKNNAASNLEWCTALENSQHALRMGLIKGYTPPEQVAEILSLRASGLTWRQLAAQTGRTKEGVRMLVRKATQRNGKTTARVLERKPG